MYLLLGFFVISCIKLTSSICINGQNNLTIQAIEQQFPEEYEIIKNVSAKYNDLIKNGISKDHPTAIQARIERDQKLKEFFVPKISQVELDEIADQDIQRQRGIMKTAASILHLTAHVILFAPDPTGITKIIGGILKGVALFWSFILGLTEDQYAEEKKARRELKEQMDALQESLMKAFIEMDKGFSKIHDNLQQRFAEVNLQFIITNFENNNLNNIKDFWKVWEIFRETDPSNLDVYCKNEEEFRNHCENEEFSPVAMLSKLIINTPSTLKNLKETFVETFDYGRVLYFVDLIVLNVRKISFLNKVCGALIGANDAYDKHLREIANQLDNFTNNLKNEAFETIKSDRVCNILLEKQENKSDIMDEFIDSPLRWLQEHYPWYRWYRFANEYFTVERPEHYHTNYLLNADYAKAVKSAFQPFFNDSDKNAGPYNINWSPNSCSYVQKIYRGETGNIGEIISYKRSHFIGIYKNNCCEMKRFNPSTHDMANFSEVVPVAHDFSLEFPPEVDAMIILLFLPMSNCTNGSCLQYFSRRGYAKGITWNKDMLSRTKGIIERDYNGNFSYNSFEFKTPANDSNWLDYLGTYDNSMHCIINRNIMHGPQIGVNNSFSFFYASVEQVDNVYFGKNVTDTLEMALLCDIDICAHGGYDCSNITMNNAVTESKERELCLQKFYILEGCF